MKAPFWDQAGGSGFKSRIVVRALLALLLAWLTATARGPQQGPHSISVHAAALRDVSTTLYVPHAVVDARRDTDVLLSNTAPTAQTVRLTFHRASWTPAAAIAPTVSVVLDGLSQRLVSVREAFDVIPGHAVEGWIAIESDSAQLAGQYAIVDTQSGRVRQRLLKLAGTLSRKPVFSGMSRSREVRSHVGLLNPNAREAHVAIEWFDRTGRHLLSEKRVLEAFGLHLASTDAVWNGDTTFVGHVEVHSTEELAAYQAVETLGREATLQMQSQEDASRVLFFPMLLNLESDDYAALAITNPSDSPLRVTLSAYDMSGKSVESNLPASEKLIRAKGSWTTLVSEVFAAHGEKNVRGYVKAEVVGEGSGITGVALFGNSDLTRLSGITAALQPARSYLFADSASTSEARGRIQLYNPHSESNAVRTYRFRAGGRLEAGPELRPKALEPRMLELEAAEELGSGESFVLVTAEAPIFATQVHDGQNNRFLLSGSRFEADQEELVESMILRAASGGASPGAASADSKGSRQRKAASPSPFSSGGLNPHGIALLSSTNTPSVLNRAVIAHAGGNQEATLIDLTNNSVIGGGTFAVGGLPEDADADVARGHSYISRLFPPALDPTVRLLRYPADVATNEGGITNGASTPYLALGSTLGPLPGSAINRAVLVNPGASPPNVAIYDITNTTRTLMTTISLGGQFGTRGVDIFSSNTAPVAVVANSNSNSVSIINLLTNTVSGVVGVGGFPFGVAINKAGTRAIVTNLGSNSATLVDLAGAGSVFMTVTGLSSPRGVAIDVGRSPNVAAVANSGNNTVAFINMDTGTILPTAAAGNSPYGVAVDPFLHLAYVTNSASNDVTVAAVPGTGDLANPSAATLTATKEVFIADTDTTDSFTPADTLWYKVTISNTSTVTASTVRFRDTTPAKPTVTNDAGGTDTSTLTEVRIDFTDFSPMSSKTIVFSVTGFTGMFMPGSMICNQGTITGRSLNFTFDDISLQTDDPITPALGDATCLKIGDPMLVALKTSSISTDGGTAGVLDPGDTLRYLTTVRNRSWTLDAYIVFTDRTPENTSLVGGSVVPSPVTADIFTSVGNIQVGNFASPLKLDRGNAMTTGNVRTVQFDVTVNADTVGKTIFNIGYVHVIHINVLPSPVAPYRTIVTHDPNNLEPEDNAAESGNNSAVKTDDNPTRRRVGS